MSKKAKKVTTTWNYRVVKVGSEWGLYEVYYVKGVPIARTENPATFTSDTDPDDVRDDLLVAFRDACRRDVLDDSMFKGNGSEKTL